VCKFEVYVEVASTDQIFGPVCVSIQRIQGSILKLWNVVSSRPEITRNSTSARSKTNMAWSVRLRKAPDRRPRPGERVSRSRRLLSQSLQPQFLSTSSLLHIQHEQREYSCNLTNVRLDILRVIESPGTTFKDKIRSPLVSIWGDLSCGFHHKPT
jgi:hypothetical protein